MSIRSEIERLERAERVLEIINDLSQDIIKKSNVEIPLEDIDHLVSLFGGRIVEGSLFDRPEKTGRDTFDIYVSKWDKERERRFYAAARLGDVLLHSNYLSDHEAFLNSDRIQYKPDNGVLDQVYMSNVFASGILMPKDMFIDTVNELDEDGLVSVNKVAEHFDVSVSSAIYRGKILGYKWG